MSVHNLKIRQLKSHLLTLFAVVATVIAIGVLLAILVALIMRGYHSLSPSLFTLPTPGPDSSGGLSNAIVGSFLVTGIAIIISIPVGLLIATFIVEFGHKSQLTRIIRFCNDTLLGAPTIVTGLFVYILLVKSLGHFSGYAGIVALCFIAIFMIARASEDVLYLVSPLLRESAVALGIPRWRIVVSIIYRSVIHGLITSCILAFARIMGETAPLLFTSLSNQFTSWDLGKPIATLPVTIYRYAMSPYPDWQSLAWAGALLITTLIIVLNVIARVIVKKKGK